MQSSIEGVAVVLKKEDKLLLTLRKAGDNLGTYEFPAGHVEANETTADTAQREVLEETGLAIDGLESLAIFGNTELFQASIAGGELTNREPHAHESVEWYSISSLPRPLGPSATYYLENYSSFK
jgi:8-oxo-dGTP diphosphatase